MTPVRTTWRARLIAVTEESVTLESANGKQASISLNRLSAEDQQLIRDYKKQLFSQLKRRTREVLFAVDALKLFQEFRSANLIDDSNREYVESKIRIFEEEAHAKTIIFGDRFLTLEQLASKKIRTKEVVDDWIKQSTIARTGENQKALRDISRSDPASIDAAIVAALHYDVFVAKSQNGQRLLEDAIQRGRRYLPVSNEHEQANLVIAINNLAVSSIRDNKVSRALKLWQQADELTELRLSDSIKYNIAKANRMINDASSGLKTDRAVQLAFGRFADRVDATGEPGGWRLLLPKDLEGTCRNQLRFVIANQEAQILSDTEIDDSRCVKCAGSAQLRCGNTVCRDGSIEVPVMGERTVTLADGTVRRLGWGANRNRLGEVQLLQWNGSHSLPILQRRYPEEVIQVPSGNG